MVYTFKTSKTLKAFTVMHFVFHSRKITTKKNIRFQPIHRAKTDLQKLVDFSIADTNVVSLKKRRKRQIEFRFFFFKVMSNVKMIEYQYKRKLLFAENEVNMFGSVTLTTTYTCIL